MSKKATKARISWGMPWIEIVVILVTLLSLFNQTILNYIWAFNTFFTEGMSHGKTILFLVWINFWLIFAFVLRKRKKKTDTGMKKAKKWLSVVIASLILGYGLGIFMFFHVADYYQISPLPTLYISTYVGDNWEAARITHNHLPKGSLFFFTNLIGIEIPKTMDSGEPMYSITPHAPLWSAMFLIIILIFIISLFFHVFYSIPTTFDSILLFLGSIGGLVTILDGGVLTSPAFTSLGILGIYIVRFYTRDPEKRITLELLVPISGLMIGAYTMNVFGVYASPLPCMVLVFSSLAALNDIKKDIKPLKQPKILLFVIFILIIGLLGVDKSYTRFLNGVELDNADTQILIYGLPRDAEATDVKHALEELPAVSGVRYISKVDWFCSALVGTQSGYNTKYIEREMKEKFRPETYLYVEAFNPSPKRVHAITIIWIDKKPDFVDDMLNEGSILDMKIVDVLLNDSNRTELWIETSTDKYYPSLGILSYLRSKGVKKCIVAQLW